MTRRVVFAGGIQAKALAKAYRLDIAGDSDEDVFFIGADAMVREAAHRVVAAADVVVTDLTAAGETVPEYLIAGNAQRIAVPVVLADFLWPFAGRPHPMNRGVDALPGGPYPAEFGDSFLDGMLEAGVAEDEAIARYLTLDIARTAALDARLDKTLIALAALDARAGFDFAGFVRAEFRKQNLFATTERLRLPLFRHIAAAVFARMGVEPERANGLPEAPFSPGAMPIHPGVLKHFGMAAPQPDHRYPILDEGTFTFEEYCRRYLRYEWNERLHAAIALAESSPAEAIPGLRLALETSPGSRAGQLALEEAERAVADSSMLSPLVLPAPVAPPLPPAAPAPAGALYAAVDAPLPDNQAIAGLMPGSHPKPASAGPPARDANAPPIFAPSGLGKLPFPTEHVTPSEPAPAADEFANPVPAVFAQLPVLAVPHPVVAVGPRIDLDDDTAPELEPAPEREPEPFSAFVADDDGRVALQPSDFDTDIVPEQQPYIELPTDFSGFAPAPEAAAAQAIGNRYTPLAPSAELIEVLPRMLSSTRGPAVTVESPFADMPETMPPPPLRPVLPPELQQEHDNKRGFVARLFGGGRG